MKANTTTNTTTATTVSASTVAAAAAAAMLDKTEDIEAAAATAVINGMNEDDFVRYVSMSYFNNASDLEALKGIQNDAKSAFKKAVNNKAFADDMAMYQDMPALDRMLAQITEPMITYGDSAMASLVQELLTEKASKVRISFELGKHSSNKCMMDDFRYIVNALKLEVPTNGPWASKLIEIYNELFGK